MKYALVLCAALLLVAGMEVAEKNPVSLYIRYMYHCSGEDDVMNIYPKAYRNKTSGERVYNFNWTIPYDLDDSVWLEGTMYGGQLYNNVHFYYKAKPFCDTIRKEIPEFFETLLTLMSLPLKCPIPAGNYTIKGLPSTWNFPTYNMPLKDQYIANYTFYRKFSGEVERLGCVFVMSVTDSF